MSSGNEIKHVGVLGMRWGRRSGGSGTSGGGKSGGSYRQQSRKISRDLDNQIIARAKKYDAGSKSRKSVKDFDNDVIALAKVHDRKQAALKAKVAKAKAMTKPAKKIFSADLTKGEKVVGGVLLAIGMLKVIDVASGIGIALASKYH